MLSIVCIPNPEKFLSCVDHCRGSVTLRLPDGSQCDLKQDHTARQMLRVMRPEGNGISLSLSDNQDTSRFLRYMLEAARE